MTTSTTIQTDGTDSLFDFNVVPNQNDCPISAKDLRVELQLIKEKKM